jgi:hypothetical protein
LLLAARLTQFACVLTPALGRTGGISNTSSSTAPAITGA